MPYFPTENDAYRILQRELPPGVYPDGAPSAYYSTADMDSIASLVGTAYANDAVIYNNFWPQTMNVAPANGEKVNAWEIKVFGSIQDTTQTLQTRINNILTKIRNKPAISLTYVNAIVASILAPSGVPFEIIEWGADTGSWTLDISQLDINTFLGPGRIYDTLGANQCPCPGGFTVNSCPPPNGLSLADVANDQQSAYTYEVRIYGTIFAAVLSLLNTTLTAIEPARSTHIITQGLNPNDQINGTL